MERYRECNSRVARKWLNTDELFSGGTLRGDETWTPVLIDEDQMLASYGIATGRHVRPLP